MQKPRSALADRGLLLGRGLFCVVRSDHIGRDTTTRRHVVAVALRPRANLSEILAAGAGRRPLASRWCRTDASGFSCLVNEWLERLLNLGVTLHSEIHAVVLALEREHNLVVLAIRDH